MSRFPMTTRIKKHPEYQWMVQCWSETHWYALGGGFRTEQEAREYDHRWRYIHHYEPKQSHN